VRDIEIQRRENDLVCASFGRGFYILDDYTPLRHAKQDLLKKKAEIFPIKRTWMYTRTRRLGGGTKASQGSAYYSAPNPPLGAVFTYYLKDSPPKSLKQKRKAAEKKAGKQGKAVHYPTWDELRAEEEEIRPVLLLTITDQDGNKIRRLKASASRGVHRTTWDLRLPSTGRYGGGLMAVPGKYTVHMALKTGDRIEPLADRSFDVVPLGSGSLPEPDRAAQLAFLKKAGKLQGAISGTNAVMQDASSRISSILGILGKHPELDAALEAEARGLDARLKVIRRTMHGDTLISRHNEPVPPSLMNRMRRALSGNWNCAPTRTQQEAFEMAARAFEKVLAEVKDLVQKDLKALEDKLDRAGAPWTPGRFPTYGARTKSAE